MDRVCTKCGAAKPAAEFHRSRHGYQRWCRQCHREYDAAYHQRNKAKRVAQKIAYKARWDSWYQELKQAPCADCGGVFHPAAMQFDHVADGEKVGNVADLSRRHSLRKMLLEIEKCELVCANCHAVRTFQRRRGVAQPG